MKTALALSLVLVSAALGCSSANTGDPSSLSSDATATTYVGIGDFKDYQGAWYDIESKLGGEFANVCGDTFCEGDYSNLTPLTVNCSVSAKEGIVHDCAWTFVGSLEVVNPNTAAIEVDAPTYQCHFKASSRTTAGALVTFLQTSSDLHDPLPGTTTSIYDGLVDCFQHPIASTPVTIVDAAQPTYVEASEYYTTGANQTKWNNTVATLKTGFDNVCGDTFCSGDFGDIQSMAFVCAVTKSTGNIKACNWVFGGSEVFAQGDGSIEIKSQSWNCPVAVKGTISQLMTTISAPVTMTNPSQPIDRPLPGVATSAYQSILNCLP